MELISQKEHYGLSKNYQVELNEPHLEEKYRKKIVVIKRQTIEYKGDKCSMILIQDVTAFHMVDQEIKENLSLIHTNMCISNQIKRPLKTIGEIASTLIQILHKMNFSRKSEFLERM